MIPELGHYALILSLFVAAPLGLLGIWGGSTQRAAWLNFARPATQALWLLTAFSFAMIWVGILLGSVIATPIAAPMKGAVHGAALDALYG